MTAAVNWLYSFESKTIQIMQTAVNWKSFAYFLMIIVITELNKNTCFKMAIQQGLIWA